MENKTEKISLCPRIKKSEILGYIENNSYNRSGGNGYVKQRAVNIKLHSNKVSDIDKAFKLLFDESLSFEVYESLKDIINSYSEKLQEVFSSLCISTNGRSGGHLIICNKEYPYRNIDIFDNLEDKNRDELKELYFVVKVLNDCKEDMFNQLEFFIKNFEIKEEVYSVEKKRNILVEKEVLN